MNIFMRGINKLRKSIFNKKYRYKVQQNYRSRIRNKDFSIICSNCFGGILYHDLGMRFTSPTINMYIEMDDYVEFLENLELYLKCDLTDGSNANGEIIGILNGKVKLYGLHYSSFQELQTKWIERRSRVNWENLFIIGVYRDGCTDESVKQFCNLPYKHKVFLSHKMVECDHNDCIVVMDCGKNAVEVPGADKMISRKSRLYDAAFDFIEWLNNV